MLESGSEGVVIKGAWNIFTVRVENPDGSIVDFECPLKGKVLRGREDFYNPLAPGDVVRLDESHSIVAARPRDNFFARFNQKGQKPQVLAANIGLVLCLASPASPPFRPRFLDRVLVQAEVSGIDAAIVVNKCDLINRGGGRTFQNEDGTQQHSLPRPPTRKPRDAGLPLPQEFNEVESRLADYERSGYRILRISAKTGEGIPELEKLIAGKTAVLVGQSGVGKSTLLNALNPQLQLKTGEVNEKWDRGNHTTTQPVLYALDNLGESASAKIIDTPGLRRMVPWGVSAADLPLYMKEFAPFAGKCAFGLSCTHTGEPGCAILAACESGGISGERYESFLRIRDEL